LIKISKQSAKIQRNYVECRFNEFHSNNILSHTRFILDSISNNVTLSNYTKTHLSTTKNDLLGFLEILK